MKKKNLILAVFLCFTLGCKEVSRNFVKIINYRPSSQTTDPDQTYTLIKNAKIYTVAGKTYEQGQILLAGDKIKTISAHDIKVPEFAKVIDAQGMQITPGLIDVHSHMGVYPSPSLTAHADGNEATKKSTPQVRAMESFWPQDPALWRALEGGVTTIQVLPGSANLVGGESFVAKLDPKTSAQEMLFKEAPRGIKMACGENPKRVYGEKGGPSTRMGNAAAFRELFQKAKEHQKKSAQTDHDKKTLKNPLKSQESGSKDFALETLKDVLSGEVLVHIHCYRADDMATMLSLAKEFGFKIRTFHHGLEAYKIKELLKQEQVSVATWADWWGFKAEAYDGIPHNLALLHKAGAKAVLHSDSARDIRFLNVEAAKARRAGLELGLSISEEEALSWITKNAAWALGVEKLVGSLEEGKMADLVVWDGHPLSTYSKPQYVFINGEMVLNRKDYKRPQSDFEVGYRKQNFYDGRSSFDKKLLKENLDEIKISEDAFTSESIDLKTFVVSDVRLNLQGPRYDVHVKDGHIEKVTKHEEAVASGAHLIPGEGKLLTPGLIETASNLALFDVEMEKTANDSRTSTEQSVVDLQALDAFNPLNIRIPISRKEGVTSNISYLSSGKAVSGVGVAFDLLGRFGSDLDSQPLMTSLYKGHGKSFSSKAQKWHDLREVLREAKHYQEGSSSKFDQTHLLKERDYKKFMPYLSGEKPWVFALDKAQDIESLLRFKAFAKKELGFSLKPVILGGAESWLRASKLFEEEIPVVLTPTFQVTSNFDSLRTREDLAAYLVENKIKVIFSAGAGYEASVRRLRQEMAFAIKYGLSWEDALKAVTQTPAEVFNLKERGQIASGMKANMVLWSGDLGEVSHRAEKVWIDGVRVSLYNRQRALAEKYLN